jgi:hypothetical protein
MIKYAIKKGERYYTHNNGWSKDIYKAKLILSELIKHNLKYEVYKDCKPVAVRETILREEV